MIVGRVAAIKPLADAVLLEVLVRHEDVAAMIGCITPPPDYIIAMANPAVLEQLGYRQQAPQPEPEGVVVQLRPQSVDPVPVVNPELAMPPIPDMLNRIDPKPATSAPAPKAGSPFKVQ